jgi:hypothetical protein
MTAAVPDAVVRSVLACTDRHPIPSPGSHAMHVIPAPRIPVGEPTPADRARACERLSTVHGRQVSGGWAVDQLAVEYALCFAAGYEAGQREQATA